MSETFEVAPLVEIIAEVKWNEPLERPEPGQVLLNHHTSALDEFYMNFGGRAFAAGFQRAERLMPPGFPVPTGTPVYRYKPTEKFENVLARSALWQVGPGLFSANAIPPYKSWTEFAPLVREGLKILIETRPTGEVQSDFSSVSLRYIDAFTEEFLRGESAAKFLREKLGVDLTIPKGYHSQLKSNTEIALNVQFRMQLEGDMTLSFQAAEGKMNGTDALILNTAVSCDKRIACNLELIMKKLDQARSIIHNAFFDMTRTIHDVMRPSEGAK